MISRRLTRKQYVVASATTLLPAIPTPDEAKILELIERTGHIWHYSYKLRKGEDGVDMTLGERKKIARVLVESGYLWRQDPVEFDLTRAGSVALEYLKENNRVAKAEGGTQ